MFSLIFNRHLVNVGPVYTWKKEKCKILILTIDKYNEEFLHLKNTW